MLNFLRRQFHRSDQRADAAMFSTAELGAFGERVVIEYLQDHSYQIVATNFTTPIGRSLSGRMVTGEIDIVAYDHSTDHPILAFIEVKTRRSAEFALPQAAVDLRKQRHITRAARAYRRLLQLDEEPFRYDVATVIVREKAMPEVTLLRDYFSETRFNRRAWRASGENW